MTTTTAPLDMGVAPASGREPVTATDLIQRVRSARAAAVAAEVDMFVLAAEWAVAHPHAREPFAARCRPVHAGPCEACGQHCPAVSDAAAAEHGDFNGACPSEGLEHDPDGFDDPFIPPVARHAAAPLGAALGRTTRAGRLLMRDALLVRHRLPRLWSRVIAGQVEPWRARRIAALVVHAPRDVAEWLDTHVTPVAHGVGLRGLDRLHDEAMLRLHPEEREAQQLEELDRRHASLDRESINHTGIAEMILRGDWADLDDFDRALSLVAEALRVRDASLGQPEESLDVRRSRAVGVLADPEGAMALLADPACAAPERAAEPPESSDRQSRRRARRVIEIVLHLTPAQLAGLDPVMRMVLPGRSGALGQPIPVLTEAVRGWCGRDDVAVRVQPVVDLDDHTRVDAYEVPGRMARRVAERAGSCAFPWCERPAIGCDNDHVVPYDHHDPGGGATCDCNLAPLCRHHHRLKTHVGWAYTTIEPGVWLWTDPHGQRFLRDTCGTRDVTPDGPLPHPPSPGRGDGCRVRDG